jgi:hypothetical protein
VKTAKLAPVPSLEPRPRERDPREIVEEQRRALSRALRGGPTSDSDWGELAMKGSSGLDTQYGGLDFQIESKSDIDWGPWGSKTVALVKRNWLSIMPIAAKVGMPGIVQVRFRVMRDGEIRDFEALSESGVIPLDQAVKDALLRLSNPLPELPIPADGVEDSIRVTYTFIYNLRDERAQREWQRKRWHEARANGAG